MKIELKRVPTLRAAQSTHSHWSVRYRERQAEKAAWIAAMLEAGLKPSPLARWDGPVGAAITVVYGDSRNRDRDNILAALKPLFDLLEPLGAHGSKARGYLGLVGNDRQLRLALKVVKADKSRAPLTLLEIKPLRKNSDEIFS